MHLSRRSLFAVLAGGTCARFVHAQGKQGGAIFAQNRGVSADLPTQLGGKDIKQWIAEISSLDPSRRENAIRTVPLLRGAEEAIPALINCVKRDNDSSPRVNAVMALGAIDFHRQEDITKAVEALTYRVTNDNQAIVRFQAALVLGRFGGQARPAMEALIKATSDQGSWEIRKAAVFALSRAAFDADRPVASPAINALVQHMSATNESSSLVRLEATMCISSIGGVNPADNKTVVAALRRAEDDKEKMIGIWARVGLCVHDNKLEAKDVDTLIKFMRSPHLPERTHAARALGTIAYVGNMGPLIKPAIPALIELTRDKEELARVAAIWALGRVGAPAKPALPRLNEMLKDKELGAEGKGFIKEAIQMIESKARD
jgi:HEAT repeat protein